MRRIRGGGEGEREGVLVTFWFAWPGVKKGVSKRVGTVFFGVKGGIMLVYILALGPDISECISVAYDILLL